MLVPDLPTPALVVERSLFEANLATMAAALPGARLRPHVKAHKCTELARRQAAAGHATFTVATVREALGMVQAGLGEDVLLANEVLDPRRLRALADLPTQVTVAVDSEVTVDAAADAGLRRVLVDVNVGLPRCGVPPEQAGVLAAHARRRGLDVGGVMGYEGHLQPLPDGVDKAERVRESMALLLAAAADVGGDVVSAGGTGTYALNTWVTEIQAGSYALMDTAYSALGLPFGPALSVLATVVSVSPGWAVADLGLKSLGMDHGNPSVARGNVWFCSDEHTTFAPETPVRAGEKVRFQPAHVDPTVAYHEQMWLVDGEEVLERWPVDLRGW